jgi:CDP-diglyceride synthetase
VVRQWIAVVSLLALLHNRFGIALLVFAAILGAWGSLQFVRRRAVSGGFRSSYLMMIGLTAVQGIAGLISLTSFRPHELLHVVYGGFAILFLPSVYFYAGRGSNPPREAAFLAAACWVVAIAFGRGILTGR